MTEFSVISTFFFIFSLFHVLGARINLCNWNKCKCLVEERSVTDLLYVCHCSLFPVFPVPSSQYHRPSVALTINLLSLPFCQGFISLRWYFRTLRSSCSILLLHLPFVQLGLDTKELLSLERPGWSVFYHANRMACPLSSWNFPTFTTLCSS